jgi:signal transduction histidine kinase/DNA-binding response OmpR family regulator
MSTLLSRWPDLTIGARLFAGFSVVLAIFLAQAVIANRALDTVAGHFDAYGRISGEANDILWIEKEIVELRRGVLAFTYSGYEGVIEGVRRRQATLDQALTRVHGAVDDAGRRNVLQRMREHFDLYNDTFEAAIEERRLRGRLIAEDLQASGHALNRTLQQLRDELPRAQEPERAAAASLALEKLLEAHRDALSFLAEPDSTLVRSAQGALADSSTALRGLHGGLPEDGRKQAAAAAMRELSRFEKTFLDIVQTTRGYMYLVYVVMPGEAAEISTLAADLKNRTLARQEDIRVRMSADVAEARRFSAAVSVAAGLAGLLAAWLITRALARPIRAITGTFTDLAEGRLDRDIPGRGRHDEIGALAQAADVFKQKAHDLENASRYKTEFLANMSHELRTPLNSMLILSKLFADNAEGNLTGDQLESARVIHESGTSLLHIINDILDLSKIEAGKMEIYPETSALVPFARSMERQFRHMADARGLAFEVELGAGLPDTFRTDWGKLEQIIRNLVSNALKFTPRGTVRLAITRPPSGLAWLNPALSGSDGRALAFAVSDTGIGIPKDKFAQIFEAFRQVDGSTSRKYGGTGLGLSISRRFADMLGGELRVESTEDEGSTFTLYLPVDRYPAPTLDAAAPAGAAEPSHALRQDAFFHGRTVKVLIVDDDERNRYALRRILASRTHALWMAGDGEEALKALAANPDADLVLMDIMMPKLDGYEAMRAIRAQERFRQLPIVALTARALPEDRDKCFAAGASAYLAKPVDPARLLDTLVDCLNRAAPRAGGPPIPPGPPVPAAEPPAGVPTPPPPLLNRTGEPATVLVVDDNMRNTYALARALQPLAGGVLMAADGQKALALLDDHPEVDIVLLDLRMPEMDGLTMLRALRAQDRHRRLPVLVLTASALPGDREACARAGADGYLVKPIDFEQLRARMAALLRGTTPFQ